MNSSLKFGVLPFNRDEQELLAVTGFGQGGPLVQNAALNAEPSVEGL
jgi:hypothetical protein